MKDYYRILLFLLLIVFMSSCSLLKKSGEEKEEHQVKTEEEFHYDAHFLEALRLKILGKTEKAIMELEKARQYIDDEAPLYYQLAELSSQMGDYGLAQKHAEKAAELDEDNIWYHILLMQLYQNAGLFADASETMENIIRLEPYKLDYYFMLSSLYQSIGKPKEAIKTMDEAEDVFGVTDVISIEKERLYKSMDETDKAIDEIKNLVEEFPDNPKYKAILAELYISVGERKKAKNIYDELESTENLEGDILLSISEFYRQSGDYDKAFDYLKQAFGSVEMDLDMKIEMLVSLLTNTESSDLETEKQRELFNILVQTHPAEPKALTVYSDFLVKVGEYDEAATVIKQVLETNRDKYLIWEQLLYIYNQLGDFDTLYRYSDTVTSLFPQQPLPYLYGSVAAYQTQRIDQSIDYSKKGLKINVDNKPIKVELLTFLGEGYHSKERFELADSAFDKVLEIDPDNIFVLNNYAYYLSLRNEKLSKARRMSAKVVKLEPDNPSYLDTHGWVLYELGEYEEALEYIQKAYRSGGSDRQTIVEHYGDAMYKNNNTEKAVKLWKAALQLSEDPNPALKNKIESGKLIDE